MMMVGHKLGCNPDLGGSTDCSTCEYYGIGMACDGSMLTVAVNAEGTANYQ